MRILALVAMACSFVAMPCAAADQQAKELETSVKIPIYTKAGTLPLTLTNGTGDGRLTVAVDGYGSFGSTTPAGDAFYDPVGPVGRSGSVWESAIFFSPFGNFLSTGGMHTGANLPPVEITRVSDRVVTSRFTNSGYAFSLRQELLPASANGSTLVQTYRITNNNTGSRTVKILRYLEGDLYFEGSFGNDFGGVKADKKTVFQFDSGDNPTELTTFVGINSTGGTSTGYSIQPYRFTDQIVAARAIPSVILNKVAGDGDNDGVTDNGYDAGIIQQNTLTIAGGATVTYTTKTIFGSGSIDAVLSDVRGCITLAGAPLAGRTVTARQPDVADKTVQTDTAGCYVFPTLRRGKTFQIIISGPTVR